MNPSDPTPRPDPQENPGEKTENSYLRAAEMLGKNERRPHREAERLEEEKKKLLSQETQAREDALRDGETVKEWDSMVKSWTALTERIDKCLAEKESLRPDAPDYAERLEKIQSAENALKKELFSLQDLQRIIHPAQD